MDRRITRLAHSTRKRRRTQGRRFLT